MTGLFDLTGRVALVTGSSRGIGSALARALVDAGATVVLNGVNPERLKDAEAAMAADFPPGRIHSVAFDVTDDDAAARSIRWIEDNVGPLEILVNNAGIQHRVPMLDLDVADWERVLSTDLTSAFLVGREAARHMIGRDRRMGGLRAADQRRLTRLHPHRNDPEPGGRRGVQLLDPRPDPRPPLGHRGGPRRSRGVAGLGWLQLRERTDHFHRWRNDGGGLMATPLDIALPATGPALVAHAAGDLRIDEVPVPQPAPDEAVVEVLYGGICGSDLHYWLHGAAGESILKAPLVLGHEISGTVVRQAANGQGPQPGTAVAVHPATPGPGAARYPADRPNLSPGCTYLGSAARYPHTDGAFSRYVNLPVRMLRPLPDSIDLRTAALIEP